MSQPNMPSPSPSPSPSAHANARLLLILLVLLAAYRPAFRQERHCQRYVALALGQLCAYSRHTITHPLVALGLGAVDWSAFDRLFSVPRLNYGRLTTCFLAETLTTIPDTPG
jgi:hypothetical protein